MCLIVIMLSFSITGCAKGVMYPHPEVETKVTTKEGGDIFSVSGRTWKNVYGTVVRDDMEHGELRYEIYLPKNYDSKKEYPFLLYLHGGSIGYNRTQGITPWSRDLYEYSDYIADNIENCIIFAPQAPGTTKDDRELENAYWSGLSVAAILNGATVNKTDSSPYLRAVEKMMADFLETGISHGNNTYNIDASRLYLAGHSQGGIGSYSILKDCPDMFAAAIIGAGIGDPEAAKTWASTTPVRILHGTEDKTAVYGATEAMAEAVKDYPNVEIITLVGKDHNIKPSMYKVASGQESLAWMAKQQRKDDKPIGVAVALIVIIIVVAIAVIWFIKRKKLTEKANKKY